MSRYYYSSQWQKNRRRAYRRAKRRCEKCRRSGVKLTGHHIEPRWVAKNDRLSNIKVLCWNCHQKEERQWRRKFESDKDYRKQVWEKWRKQKGFRVQQKRTKANQPLKPPVENKTTRSSRSWWQWLFG